MALWMLPIGAGALILGYLGVKEVFSREPKKEEETTPPAPQIPSVAPAPMLVLLKAPIPSPQSPGHLVNHVAEFGKARQAAEDLYHHLKLTGVDGSAELKDLVLSFQKANGSDAKAVAITGPTPATGVYDARTSAALTIYTRDPIAPPLGAPMGLPLPSGKDIKDATVPSHGMLAGLNLYAYLLKEGDNRSANEFRLVQEFQKRVNDNPKFPGPANRSPQPTRVFKKLPENGDYGDATAEALRVVSGVLVPPRSGPQVANNLHIGNKHAEAKQAALRDAPSHHVDTGHGVVADSGDAQHSVLNPKGNA